MADTVVVTSPDDNGAALQPTLTDAVAAAQFYYLQIQEMQTSVFAAEAQANIAAADAQAAANEAIAAAVDAAAAAVAGVIANMAKGTPTMATLVKLQRQLIVDGNYQTVADYIMNTYADTDPEAVEWRSAVYVPAPGLLYTAIKNALSYTDSQALALWLNAYLLTD